MIVIDMGMPTDCVDCPIDCFPYGAEDTDYSTTNRPSYCPIKCDIEDIKAEIKAEIEFCAKTSIYTRSGFDTTLHIIDKHIK